VSTVYKPSKQVAKIVADVGRPPMIPGRTPDPEGGNLFSELLRGDKYAIDQGSSIPDRSMRVARVCVGPKVSNFKQFLNWVGFDGTDIAKENQIIVYCPSVHSYIPDPFVEARRLKIWPYEGTGNVDELKQKFESLVYTYLTTGPYSSATISFLGNDEELAEEYSTLQPGDWVKIGYMDEVNRTDGVYLAKLTGRPNARIIPDAPGSSPKAAHKSSRGSVMGSSGYPVRSSRPWGPGWRDRVPKGLTPNHRLPGVRGSANELIREHAATHGLAPEFTEVMLDLARTESGAMLGRPARPPYSSSGGYGAFQWNQGAWDHARFGGKVTDISPVDEIAKPIGYYAKLWRQVSDKGGNSLAAARHLRVWHRSPMAAKTFRKFGKKNDYDWEKAWQELPSSSRMNRGKAKLIKFNQRSIKKTNHDMRRLGYA